MTPYHTAMRAAGMMVLATSLATGCHAGDMQIGEGNADPRTEALQAVQRFLSAFERLDWPAFTAAFGDDATVFFPPPAPPGRFAGRAAFEPEFRNVFETLLATRPSGPPYHLLEPEEMAIEMLAPDTALVTFLLRNDRRIARRTLILVRRDNDWRIRHLHASNVAAP